MCALYLWLYYGHTKNDGYAWWLSDSLRLELWMVAVLYLVSLRPAPIAAPSVKVRPAKKGSRPVMAATCHNPRIKEALAARIKWTKAYQKGWRTGFNTWRHKIGTPNRIGIQIGNTDIDTTGQNITNKASQWAAGVAGEKSLMRTPQLGGQTKSRGELPTFPLMSSRSFNLCIPWWWGFCIAIELGG